jgi:hypothetical protein
LRRGKNKDFGRIPDEANRVDAAEIAAIRGSFPR